MAAERGRAPRLTASETIESFPSQRFKEQR